MTIVNHALTTINMFSFFLFFWKETFVLPSDPTIRRNPTHFSCHDQKTRQLPCVHATYLVLMMITGLKPQQMANTSCHCMRTSTTSPTSQAAPFSMFRPALRLCAHAVGLYNCGPGSRANSGCPRLPPVTFSPSEVSVWKRSFVPGADRSPPGDAPLGIPT